MALSPLLQCGQEGLRGFRLVGIAHVTALTNQNATYPVLYDVSMRETDGYRYSGKHHLQYDGERI